MNSIYASMEKFRPYILSILRIVIGLLFLEHGLSKVFNFPAPSPVPSLSGLLILAAILETVGAASCFSSAPIQGLSLSSCPAKWPSPISWRMRRAHFTRSSMAGNWRSSTASCSSISPLPAAVR